MIAILKRTEGIPIRAVSSMPAQQAEAQYLSGVMATRMPHLALTQTIPETTNGPCPSVESPTDSERS